ncbi:aggregation-promoting factor C-terminal-like domain-containing protein [Microterricola pindariensis]|uniref:aggregation-promoting factor C-terminal-like domain-containing protein n=1 Tax=Microterricola pindariensis TaxID=478010 RepID=UPI001882BAD2|nr:lytic transglycosylase domain-containing protein [Microterricola pindariensis]
MLNSNSSTNSPDQPALDAGVTRSQLRNRRRGRKKLLLLAGAVVAVGAMAGTGFVVQTSVVAQNERDAASATMTAATGFAADQLAAYSTVANANAASTASATIDEANLVIAAAAGKTDAGDLASSVAALSNFELLTPSRVFKLVDTTKGKSAGVQAATAEVDRVAAEQQAAAEAAAAAAAAAAQAQADAEAAAQESSSSNSGGSRPSAPSDPSGAQAIARDLMASQYGWGEDQFGCLVALWNKESGWNINAYNASSGAAGIPQALPGSKMASAGADWQTNPATQITWGLGYISGRYGTPCGAWDTSESQGWY